jgi:hypothetical protein
LQEQGHWITGKAMICAAYAASLLLVEGLFCNGQAQAADPALVRSARGLVRRFHDRRAQKECLSL